jgi:dihydroorotate dehydrogenase electron transfer subunit
VKRRGVFDVKVSSVRHLTGDYCLLALELPRNFPEPEPGQFVMVHGKGRYPLLGRPLSIHDYRRAGRVVVLELLLREVGEGTRALAALRKGDSLILWGPQGNGFKPDLSGPQILVAGGRGIAPMWLLGKRIKAARKDLPALELFYGAASSDELHYVDEFRDMGFKVHIATDDGSRGYRGIVTNLLREKMRFRPEAPAVKKHRKAPGVVQLGIFAEEKKQAQAQEEKAPEARPVPGTPPVFYTCGPIPMMAEAHRVAMAAGGRCQVSLEARMACGIGVCLGCAHVMADDSQIHVCDDGPVLDSVRVFGGVE